MTLSDTKGDPFGLPDELHAHPGFRRVYESPGQYAGEAAEVMVRADISTRVKAIVGYAMQRLDRTQYVELLNQALDSVDAGRTEPVVIDSFAFPSFEWGHQWLVMDYDAPDVQVVLHRIEQNVRLEQSTRNSARKALSGAAKDDLSYHRRHGL